jgi:hypothetical protein
LPPRSSARDGAVPRDELVTNLRQAEWPLDRRDFQAPGRPQSLPNQSDGSRAPAPGRSWSEMPLARRREFSLTAVRACPRFGQFQGPLPSLTRPRPFNKFVGPQRLCPSRTAHLGLGRRGRTVAADNRKVAYRGCRIRCDLASGEVHRAVHNRPSGNKRPPRGQRAGRSGRDRPDFRLPSLVRVGQADPEGRRGRSVADFSSRLEGERMAGRDRSINPRAWIGPRASSTGPAA